MKVLITGGSGYLGRGIITHWPQNEYIVYSRDEYKQDIARRILGAPANVKWFLGDVLDLEKLTYSMADVDLVVHAAAVKYIPEAEMNVHECVRVNVDGSRNVIDAAIRSGVTRVVGISTDKVVEPVNAYGMSKALMERMFVEANRFRVQDHAPYFTCTRYGNVLGSTGSVVSVFKAQAQSDGIIKVTNPNMTRFWQSVSESVRLVQIAASANPGIVIIPRGRSSTIQMVAEYCLSKFGARDIEVVGVRPGEKMHESLIGQYESTRVRNHELDTVYQLYPVGSKDIGEPFKLTSYDQQTITHQDIDQMLTEAEQVGY